MADMQFPDLLIYLPPVCWVNDLYFSYPNGVEALSGVSLAIEAGEQVAIVGQNGAGKTTVMRIIYCFMPPGSGEVKVFNIDVTKDLV